ncbi:DUF2207 domain-containing protein [Faunimonas sp. B44]|uniref:DUF2207 domain-containing protein n=1 Tax=Faunimonas sp. B44 TaxID=3461493 RepID=UPI0040441DC4
MRAFAKFLIPLLFLLAAGGARAAEQIERFDSRIEVAADGVLRVTETIRVRAEGRDIRRGIYRDFPLAFEDAEGRRREVTFEINSVRRDNGPEEYRTERRGDAIRIYAGRSDVLLQPGEYTYIFSYTTGRQVRWPDGKPELYWNVTGNFWSFPILKAAVRVVAAAAPTRWTAYTGPLRARGTAFAGAVAVDGALSVETTRRLGPGEGLTIVAEYPEGTVAEPTGRQRALFFLLDHRAFIIGGVGMAAVLAYYLAAWNAVGRDPKGGPVIPLFGPPEEVSPALANYIHNWGFTESGWRAFTAAALSLAVRGLVLFDQAGDTLVLRRTPKAADLLALPPGERAVLGWVEQEGGTGRIEKANGEAVVEAGKRFRRSIEGENRYRFFRHNIPYFLVGLGLSIATGALVVLYGGLGPGDFAVLAPLAFLSVAAGFVLVPMMRTILTASSTRVLIRTGLALAALFAFLVMQAAEALGSRAGGTGVGGFILATLRDHPVPIALFMAFALVNGLFFYLLRAPTSAGRKVMDELEGFRLYLTTAEQPRLDMHPPEIDAERFEALLPYAVALGAERQWASAFEAALRRAHPDDPDPVGSYRPDWRTGSWSGRSFSRAVASSVGAATASFAGAMPRASSGSSGFGGGGGSGGGGGGGGGGGW